MDSVPVRVAWIMLASGCQLNDPQVAQLEAEVAELQAQLADLTSRLEAIETGPAGPTGPAGEVGPTGEPGPQGEPGPSVVSVNGKQYSLAAFYCGSTAALTGNVGGYDGAKALCEVACSSESAHVCDAGEVSRSAQVGILDGAVGWYATATFAPYVGQSGDRLGEVQDCVGFTSADATDGPSRPVGVNYSSGGYPHRQYCSDAFPILCCD